jgi:GSH-dependent disulfide-bond oxidoreductase
MLELYHWEPTANSAEPLICLEEKNASYEPHYVNLLRFEQHRPAFLKLNPQGQVPVLVHDGRVITETSLLIQYLDATFPSPRLTPQSALERYQMQVWLRTSDDYFGPALALLGWHLTGAARSLTPPLLKTAAEGIARLPPERQAVWKAALENSYSEEQLGAARNSLGICARRLESALLPRGWLAGAEYSLADIAIFPMARSLARLLPDVVNQAATPGIIAWLQKIEQRPAVNKVLRMARSASPETSFAPGPEPARWG